VLARSGGQACDFSIRYSQTLLCPEESQNRTPDPTLYSVNTKLFDDLCGYGKSFTQGSASTIRK
jgi:hypothetical protein